MPPDSPDRPFHTPLGSGGEFDRIRGILRRLGDRAGSTGDDCAIVTVGREQLAVSTDIALEGTHFQVGWLSPLEIGWRAAAAGFSDLAAVAATPAGVLVSLGVPSEWPEEFISELMEGVGDLARDLGASVWGGDLVRADRVVIDVVAIGSVQEPVMRRGASVGDGLWVTGSLGGPAAALRCWNAGVEPEATARERFVRPRPRIAEAVWLRQHGARAMIDISDGLLGDAGHLAAASDVAWEIESERVPVHGAASPEDALMSGEEYELLVALPDEMHLDAARAFEDEFRIPLTRIGRAREGGGVTVLKEGSPTALPAGFAHF